MPRAYDLLVPKSDHDPLANLLDFSDIDTTAGQAGSLIKTWGEGLLNGVVEVIKELTGIDLTSWDAFIASLQTATGIDLNSLSAETMAFLDSIVGAFAGLDLSSPTAFYNSFITELDSLLHIDLTSMLTAGSPLDASKLFGMISDALIPLLDASKIGTGQFSSARLQPLIDAISTAFGGGTGLSFSSLNGVLMAIPGAQAVIDAIANGLGHAGTGHTPSDILGYLGLIPGGNIATPVSAGVIPSLDASKITTGVLNLLRIPGLDVAHIPNLDASQITTGVLNLLRIPGLDVAHIPALDAGQITTGTFGAGLIPALDGSKITTGLLALARIPGLDVAHIPSLPAGQITSGAFAPAQIPGLDGSKITGGTIAQAFLAISNLAASVISSGVFSGAQIPVLDAGTKLSGTVPIGQIPTGSLGLSNITDLQAVADNVTNALIGAGAQYSSTTIPQARGSMDAIYNNVLNAIDAIQAMRSTTVAQGNSGVNVNVNFSNYPDGALPSSFTVSYFGTGSSTIGIKKGNAGWATLNSDGDRGANVMYNVAPTNTDFQIVRGTMAAPPAQQGTAAAPPRIWAIGRADSATAPANYVWARAYCTGFLTYKADVGCTVAGTETVFSSGISLTWSLDITVVIGVNNTPRRYQAFSGTQLVFDYTEAGTTSKLGAGFRLWGCRTEMKSGTFGGTMDPGGISSTSVSDNAAPAVVGSGMQQYRAGGNVTPSFTVNTPVKFPASFFDTNAGASADMGISGNAITIGSAGWYTATIHTSMTLAVGAGSGDWRPVVFKNNGAHKAGPPVTCANVAGAQVRPNAFGGSIEFYAVAGDVIEPGYLAEAQASLTFSTAPVFSGDVNGVLTYWTIDLSNKSLA